MECINCNTLKQLLHIEIVKNSIYQQLIKQLNNIDLSNIITSTNTSITIDEYKIPSDISIQVILKNTPNIHRKKSVKKEETNSIIEIDIKELQRSKRTIKKKVYNTKDKDIDELIQSLLDYKNTKISNVITKIKKYRNRLMSKVSLSHYVEIINNNINLLDEILIKKEVSVEDKKKYIFKSLSSIDCKLVLYDKFYTTSITDIGDIPKLKEMFIKNIQQTTLTVFNPHIFLQKISTYPYLLCFFKIDELLSEYFSKTKNFPNLVYIDPKYLPNSTETDIKYSFYSLVSLDKKWSLESNLETIGSMFSSYLINDCIKIFRTIYFSIYSNNLVNDYPDDMKTNIKDELKVILQNILLLSRQNKFMTVFKNIIIENCSYIPTIDTFNFTTIDPIQLKNCVKNNTKTLTENIRSLFDDLSRNNKEHLSIIVKYIKE